MPQQQSVIERLLLRLAAWQLRAPWHVLFLGFVLTVTGAWLARGLELRTRFDQLLPDDQPSVLELKRLSERTAGSSSIFVVLDGPDRETLRAVGGSLLKPLRAVGAPWVVSAEDGVQVAREFLLPRSGLFASVEDLQKLNKELDTQRKKAVGKALSLGLDDEEEQKAPTFAELKEKFLGGKSATLEAAKDRYPDGYFQSKDGKTLVVLVRTGIATGELERSREALSRVKDVVQKTLPDAEARGIKIGYAGDSVTGLFEYGAVLDDLVSVGTTGVALILGGDLHLLPALPGAGAHGGHDVRRAHLHLRADPAGHRPSQRHHRVPGLDHRRERHQLRRALRRPLPRGAPAGRGPRRGHPAGTSGDVGGHAHRRARRRRGLRKPRGDPVPRVQALRVHRYLRDAALLAGDVPPRPGGAHPPGPPLAHRCDRIVAQLVPALAAEALGVRAPLRLPRVQSTADDGHPLAGAGRGRRGGLRPLAAGRSDRLRHEAHAERPRRRQGGLPDRRQGQRRAGQQHRERHGGPGQHPGGGA